MHTNLLKKTHYINAKDKNASQSLAKYLLEYLQSPGLNSTYPVFVCIGSDRVTGDSLGPLVGTQLKKYLGSSIPVYGTLDSPIHALNLEESMDIIKERHSNHPIIAVDASLGTKRHLGYISIGKGSLLPGAGVEKELSAVGDIFITGIINTAGKFAHLALQTTRLSAVISLADCIMDGVMLACENQCSNTSFLRNHLAFEARGFTECDDARSCIPATEYDDSRSPMPALAPTAGATLDAH